jgi:deoxyribodipyrimidine photo-lyase
LVLKSTAKLTAGCLGYMVSMQQNLWPMAHSAPALEPSRTAALARLAAVDAQAYARSRNFLHGAVTRLSPYLTHGLLTVSEVFQHLAQRHPFSWQDKLVFELAWRTYFHHTWHCLGNEIWQPRHPPPAPRYAQAMPQDVLQGATGVPIIDAQVRVLYSTGYLHNHARMWLAAYIVHLRKVDWHVGAAWMYAHLLDGDLASNTLSWQWVAGTWTGKPYVFNAENVRRYAGVDCSGTALARSYAAMDACTRDHTAYSEAPAARDTVQSPASGGLELLVSEAVLRGAEAHHAMPRQASAWLMHPWSLHLPEQAQGQHIIGVWVDEFHAAYPWNSRRYAFVLAAMRARCNVIIAGKAQALPAMLVKIQLHAVPTLNPQYQSFLQACGARLHARPGVFDEPSHFKKSFSSYWNTISRGAFPV